MVKFFDHAFADGKTAPPIECHVAGWVVTDTVTHITVESWKVVHPASLNKHNHTTFTIIKQAGTRIRSVREL